MTECIEREKVLKIINQWKRDDTKPHYVDYSAGWNEALGQIESDVKDTPAADARPERHGQWSRSFERDYRVLNHHGVYAYGKITAWICSECGGGSIDKGVYCNMCGAKMDENGR